MKKLFLCLPVLLVGCSSADIAYQGATYHRSAFMSSLQVGEMTLTVTTNGVTQVTVKNLVNDAVTGAKVVADALAPLLQSVVAGGKAVALVP